MGTKPNALTHRSDVYPKGDGRGYTQANLQNLQSVLKLEQFLAAITMDHVDITSHIIPALENNVYTQEQIRHLHKYSDSIPDDKEFTLSDDKLLCCNMQIYVPDADDLRLDIL